MHDLNTYFANSMTLDVWIKARVGRKIRQACADDPTTPRGVVAARLTTVAIDTAARRAGEYRRTTNALTSTTWCPTPPTPNTCGSSPTRWPTTASTPTSWRGCGVSTSHSRERPRWPAIGRGRPP